MKFDPEWFAAQTRHRYPNRNLEPLAKEMGLTHEVSVKTINGHLCSISGRSSDGKWHNYDWDGTEWQERAIAS